MTGRRSRSPEAIKRRKAHRAKVNREQRVAQHGQPCTYCARPMDINVGALYPTKDHTEPASRGGRITVWACQTCNAVKRDMTTDQWAFYRFEHPEWWRGGRAQKAAKWRITNHQGQPIATRIQESILNPMPCETGPEAEGNGDALTA